MVVAVLLSLETVLGDAGKPFGNGMYGCAILEAVGCNEDIHCWLNCKNLNHPQSI